MTHLVRHIKFSLMIEQYLIKSLHTVPLIKIGDNS
jgi:hypothetical protein